MKNMNAQSKIKKAQLESGIPDNITRDHIISAINLINEEGIPRKRDIRKYYVDYMDRRYPCKLLISKANIFANNEELHWDPRIFQSQSANRCLSSLGFKVQALY